MWSPLRGLHSISVRSQAVNEWVRVGGTVWFTRFVQEGRVGETVQEVERKEKLQQLQVGREKNKKRQGDGDPLHEERKKLWEWEEGIEMRLNWRGRWSPKRSSLSNIYSKSWFTGEEGSRIGKGAAGIFFSSSFPVPLTVFVLFNVVFVVLLESNIHHPSLSLSLFLRPSAICSLWLFSRPSHTWIFSFIHSSSSSSFSCLVSYLNCQPTHNFRPRWYKHHLILIRTLKGRETDRQTDKRLTDEGESGWEGEWVWWGGKNSRGMKLDETSRISTDTDKERERIGWKK